MFLQELGDRIKRTLSPSSSDTAEKQEQTASTNRSDRAGSIAQLQSDVTRLQHEIADLSASLENGLSDVDKAAATTHIEALQKELEHSQHELAKLQGRV